MSTTENHDTAFKITRSDEEKKRVWGLVYEPNVLDTWGEMMLPADVETMAYRFMQKVELAKSIDQQHDEVPTECYPIESFIARKGDPDYPEGAWILGVQIVGEEVWKSIKDGKINGFSFQCMVRKAPAIVEVEIETPVIGLTEVASDHDHTYMVEIDEEGVIIGGRTSTVNGHFHLITKHSVTEQSAGHFHTYIV